MNAHRIEIKSVCAWYWVTCSVDRFQLAYNITVWRISLNFWTWTQSSTTWYKSFGNVFVWTPENQLGTKRREILESSAPMVSLKSSPFLFTNKGCCKYLYSFISFNDNNTKLRRDLKFNSNSRCILYILGANSSDSSELPTPKVQWIKK